MSLCLSYADVRKQNNFTICFQFHVYSTVVENENCFQKLKPWWKRSKSVPHTGWTQKLCSRQFNLTPSCTCKGWNLRSGLRIVFSQKGPGYAYMISNVVRVNTCYISSRFVQIIHVAATVMTKTGNSAHSSLEHCSCGSMFHLSNWFASAQNLYL